MQKGDSSVEIQKNKHEILCEENPYCTCGHKYLDHYKRVHDILLSFCCVTGCDCKQFQNRDEEKENLDRFLNEVKRT